jgi:hypothetical protein
VLTHDVPTLARRRLFVFEAFNSNLSWVEYDAVRARVCIVASVSMPLSLCAAPCIVSASRDWRRFCA